MKKLLLFLILLIPCTCLALDNPDLYSKAYIVYDETDNKLILEHNSNEQRAIASLTKMMSTIIAIEKNPDLNKKVTITQEMLNTVPWDAAIIHLKAGDELTVEDLIYATLLPSGADAVNSLAIATAGDLPSFVKLMNEKAQELGLTNTSFENPIGMDHKNNYSTASDVHKLLKYVLANEQFKKMFESKEFTMTNGVKVEATAKTFGDQINLDTSRIIGDKTGFTDPAEFCIAYEFTSHDHLYYAVTLGAPVENFKDFKHLRDANTIINYVDNNYSYVTIVNKGNLYKDIDVIDSSIDKLSINYDKDITILLPNDYNKEDIKITDNLPVNISYKNKKGEQIGTLNIHYNGELIYTQAIILNEDIKPSVKEYIKIHFVELLLLVIIFIALISLTIFVIKRHK